MPPTLPFNLIDQNMDLEKAPAPQLSQDTTKPSDMEESIKARRRCRRRGIGAAIFVTFILLMIVAILDLKLSDMKTIQVERLTLDATQALPHASAEFILEHGSRFSSVTPVAAKCAVTSGDLLVDIAPTPQPHGFTVNVTCDQEAVESHADLIWNVITAQQGSVVFACAVDVQIRLLYSIPFTQTVDLGPSTISLHDEHYKGQEDYGEWVDLSNYIPAAEPTQDASETFSVATATTQQEQQDPQATTPTPPEPTTWVQLPQATDPTSPQPTTTTSMATSGQEQGHGPQPTNPNPQQNEGNESTVSPFEESPNTTQPPSQDSSFRSPTLLVQQVSSNRLDLAVRLELPKTTHQLAPKVVRVILPPLYISAHPDVEEQAGGILWLSPFDESFILREDPLVDDDASGDEDDHEEKMVLFGFTCETIDCSWFRPMMDLFLNSATYGTSLIYVSVEGEGSFMEILLGRQHTFNVYTGKEHVSKHRHLAMSKTKEEAQAECLRVDDEKGDFDVSLCWLLDPSDGFLLVGYASLFDFAMDGFAQMEWETGDKKFTMDMMALMEMGDDSEMMDVSGKMIIDWQEKLKVNFDALNKGDLLPFEMDMSSEGKEENDVLTMTLNKANIKVDGDDILSQATGSAVLDLNERTFDAKFEDPDMKARLKGELVDTGLVLTSQITRADVVRWDSSFDARVFESAFNVGNLEVNFKETTNNYLMSGLATLDRNERSLTANIDDSRLKVLLNGAVVEAEEAFKGAFGMSWHGDVLFYTEWEGRLLPTSQEDTVKVSMRFVETETDFSMRGAVTAFSVDNVITFDVDTLIFQLRQTKHVDMTARLVVDVDFSSVEMTMQDAGSLDFVANMDGKWCTKCSSDIRLELTNGVVSRDSETLFKVDIAVFEDNGGEGSISLTSQDSGKLNLDFLVDYGVQDSPEGFQAEFKRIIVDWEDKGLASIEGNILLDLDATSFEFAMKDPTVLDMDAKLSAGLPEEGFWGGSLHQLLLRVEEETYVDLSAHYLVGEEEDSMDMLIKDSGNMDFEADMKSSWYSTDSSWGFEVQNALLRSGSRTFFHCAGEFDQDDTTNVGTMDFETTPESEVKMIMESKLVWDEDDEAFMMAVDRMFLGWKDSIYMDIGVNAGQSGTLAPTTIPTIKQDHFYSFTGIEMRLEGVKELSEEALTAFERAAKKFYQNIYAPAGIRQRQLQQGTVTSFETNVTVTKQILDDGGNTITYDQTISFTTDRPNVNKDVAAVLISGPLISDQTQTDFIETLKEEDEQSFAKVTGVSAPRVRPETTVPPRPEPTSSPVEKDEDSDSSSVLPVILGIIGGLLACCCCGGGWYYARNKGLLGSSSGDPNSAAGGISEPQENDDDYYFSDKAAAYDPPEAQPDCSFHDESAGGDDGSGSTDESDEQDSDSYEDEGGESSEEYDEDSSSFV